MTEAQDLSHFVRRPADGVAAMDLVVDGVYCGACIVTIEKGLRRELGVRGARVNLASKRVTVEWNDGALDPPVILERLEALGYPAHPFAAETVESVEIQAERQVEFECRWSEIGPRSISTKASHLGLYQLYTDQFT